MTFSKKHEELISSRDFQYARELLSLTPVSAETRKKLSIALLGRPFSKKGIPLSKERKEQISKATSGSNNGMYGKKHTLESIEKNRKSNTGKIQSEETKSKIAKSHIGKTRSEDCKLKMKVAWEKRKIEHPMSASTKRKIGENTSIKLKGKHHSTETKKKQSDAHKGIKQLIVYCPYCNKQCSPSTLIRWHNDNCKFKA